MGLPQVVTYNLSVSSVTAIALSQGATSSPLTLNGGVGSAVIDTGVPPHQRKIIVTSAGNDSAIGFKVVGLNQALQTVSEVLTGGNATFAQSVLDYLRVVSIAPVTLANPNIATTTSSTVTAGTNGVGSCLWNLMDTYAMPLNSSLSVAIVTGAVNYTVQYTYDDVNAIPIPNIFTTSMSAATTALDVTAQANFFAWKVQVNSGTGILRATAIQAGIGN
jgi:hypothetical protein